MADEKADKECVQHHDASQVAVVVNVRRLQDVEVQERESRAQRADRVRTKGPDIVDQAVVYKRRDATVAEQPPSVFGRAKVVLAVESNLRDSQSSVVHRKAFNL